MVGRLGRFELPLPDGRVLSLDGKIDRLDVAQINGSKVALILDYKRSRSGASFDWGGFYHGLDVQLAIYMLAVHQCGAGIADEVAGALCVPIETTPASLLRWPSWRTRRGPASSPIRPGGSSTAPTGSTWIPTRRGSSAFYNFYVKKDGDPYGKYETSNAF